MVQGPYREHYVAFKRREVGRLPELTEILRGRRGLKPETEVKGVPAYADMRARRKTVKLFLSHAWEVSRVLAGRPTGYAYAFSVLGHPMEHHIPPPNWTRPAG